MNVSDLPRHRGMPVPHVALWSAEAPTLVELVSIRPMLAVNALTGQPFLHFAADPDLDARCRDSNGVLWTPEHDAQGQGEARLSQLHGKRQRHSLLDGHCQVCDTRLDPVTFLLPRSWWGMTGVKTQTAPLCRDCGPTALRYCPHLRDEGPWAWATATVEHAGYAGDLTVILPGGRLSQEKGAALSVNDPRLPLLLAKQAVGGLTIHEWEEVP